MQENCRCLVGAVPHPGEESRSFTPLTAVAGTCAGLQLTLSAGPVCVTVYVFFSPVLITGKNKNIFLLLLYL